MISVGTIVQFLCFREAAHRLVMQSRDVRWLGVLFVLSAGFAREYDGEYLLADWWFLLIPLAASIVGSFALSLLVWITAWIRGVRTIGLLKTYGAILNAYWLTAPLAWLYAIPVERFLGEIDAVRANLTLLGIVSVWRVGLMLRSLKILYQCRYWEALMPIMVFSLLVGYIAIQMLPVPLFVVMGGVRVPESEQIIVDTRLQITLVAILTTPVWILGLIAVWCTKRKWLWSLDDVAQTMPVRTSLLAYCLGIASLLIWIPFLPLTQSEQYQRWTIEQLVAQGDFKAAAAWSHGVDETKLPPHWIPPPRCTYGYADRDAIRQSVAILNENPAQWYADQCKETLRENLGDSFGSNVFGKLDNLTLKGMIKLHAANDLDDRTTQQVARMAKWTLAVPDGSRSSDTNALLEEIQSWKAVEENSTH